MFGIMEAMLSFLRRQVGLRSDVADGAGSLHAKIVYTKEQIETSVETRQKPRGPAGAFGVFSTTLSSYQTVLDITGVGILRALQARQASSGPSAQVGVKITVDGYVVSDCISPSATATNLYYPAPDFLFNKTGETAGLATVANGGCALLGLNFKDSLKIEVKKATSGDAASVYWFYETE